MVFRGVFFVCLGIHHRMYKSSCESTTPTLSTSMTESNRLQNNN